MNKAIFLTIIIYILNPLESNGQPITDGADAQTNKVAMHPQNTNEQGLSVPMNEDYHNKSNKRKRVEIDEDIEHELVKIKQARHEIMADEEVLEIMDTMINCLQWELDNLLSDGRNRTLGSTNDMQDKYLSDLEMLYSYKNYWKLAGNDQYQNFIANTRRKNRFENAPRRREFENYLETIEMDDHFDDSKSNTPSISGDQLTLWSDEELNLELQRKRAQKLSSNDFDNMEWSSDEIHSRQDYASTAKNR